MQAVIKISHFFACLDRLRLIQRWSLMRNIEKENLAEHSLQVAFVAHALAVIKNKFYQGHLNPDRIAVMAMYHDTSEIFTGDLPTPLNISTPKLHKHIKKLKMPQKLIYWRYYPRNYKLILLLTLIQPSFLRKKSMSSSKQI